MSYLLSNVNSIDRLSIKEHNLFTTKRKSLPVNSLLCDVDCDSVGPLDVVPDDGDVGGAVHAGPRDVRVAAPVGVEEKS